MADSKRKEHPTGAGERGGKRSKGGSSGKWKTPHQIAKGEKKWNLEPGDQGIWATCVKGKEGKCVEELKILFAHYADKLYGIKSDGTTEDAEEEDEDDDNIEASIRKEIAALNSTGKQKLFYSVRIDIPCVLFFKTREPIKPVEFVKSICEDAKGGEPKRSRFVNRLTPMVMMGKATEKGLEEVGKAVIGEVFGWEGEEKNGGEVGDVVTYSIRPTIRASNSFRRDAVIKQVANLVPARHKVDLTKPDKVIIVEIYQTLCGMSVVGGSDWENLKKFNIAEIYQPASTRNPAAGKSQLAGGNEVEAKAETTTDTITNAVQTAEAGD